MLQAVQEMRWRFSLRVNERQRRIHFWNVQDQQWELIQERMLATSSAAIQGGSTDKTVDFFSIMHNETSILMADVSTNRTVGRVTVQRNGALEVADAPQVSITEPLPSQLIHRVAAIIGIEPDCSVNILDQIGDNSDIIRFKGGNRKMFVPPKYTRPTMAYDRERPDKHGKSVEDTTATTESRSETPTADDRSTAGSISNRQLVRVNAPPTPPFTVSLAGAVEMRHNEQVKLETVLQQLLWSSLQQQNVTNRATEPTESTSERSASDDEEDGARAMPPLKSFSGRRA